MADHAPRSPTEAAYRLAIRELFDAYAHCADRRDRRELPDRASSFTADGERKIMIASLRYLDSFVKIEGTSLFEQRKLILDWSETRTSAPEHHGPRRSSRRLGRQSKASSVASTGSEVAAAACDPWMCEPDVMNGVQPPCR